MKYLISAVCASFLISLSVNAAPITWYLDDPFDDPSNQIYGAVTFDGIGVQLDVAGFGFGTYDTWTGTVACIDPAICSQTTPKSGDFFGGNATLAFVFDLPLFIADIINASTVDLNYFVNTPLGSVQRQVSMTTNFIPTPPLPPRPTVPTPATLALFGLGLAGLGWSRRKKA